MQGLFNLNKTGLCTGHNRVLDGITPHKSPLQKGEECSGKEPDPLCSGIVFASESRGTRFESSN